LGQKISEIVDNSGFYAALSWSDVIMQRSLNMCFNLGLKGLLGFNNTLAFIKAGDWERAANGMLASKWAKQVGMRAIELSEIRPLNNVSTDRVVEFLGRIMGFFQV